MVLAVMLASLFMNASLMRAFGDAQWVFVATFLGIQLGRTAWMLTTPLDSISREHFVATLVWLAATAPLWIAGGAVSAHLRLVVWGAAAGIDVVGMWLAHPLLRRRLRWDRVEFGGEHLAERCRLFLLIALGETVVTPGAALASAPIRAATLVSGTVALASTLCLWSLYFRAEPLALAHVASAGDRVDASRIGVNGLLFMIAGLIALAAGNALVIDHPSHDTTLALALMLAGGPAIFLLARAWYQRIVFGTAAGGQLVTIGLLTATAAGTESVPSLVAALAVVGVLAGLVVVERPTAALSRRRSRP